jgi:hypothetical protein
MMTEVELNDVTLWVEYNFYDGEKQTNDYVGSAPDVDLFSIFVGTQDCITNSKGRVYVFTEKEYQHMNWWQSVKLRYEI